MSFDWTDYLKLADELCAKPFSSRNTEAKRRSAISRAYYAAFGRSRGHLRRRDGDRNIPIGPEAHEYVRLKFERSPNRTRRRVASNLVGQLGWRVAFGDARSDRATFVPSLAGSLLMARLPKDPLRPLSPDEDAWLERLSRSRAEPAAPVARATALLAVAAGQRYTEAARTAGRRSGEAVAQLVARFNREGLAALTPGPGGGQPKR